MEATASAADGDLRVIVAAAASGDELAFARIIAAHHDDLRRVCGFVMKDDALGEDAAQNAWAIAWRKLGSLRDPDRLRPWLMRIAVNEAKKLLKQRARRRQTEVVADIDRVSGGVDPATGVDALDALAAVNRLDADDRALLVMRYVLGFDSTELGAAFGLSPSGTRRRLQRLLQRLREELE